VFTNIQLTQEEKKLIYQEKDGQANAHEDVGTLKWFVTTPLMTIMLHEVSLPVCEFGLLSKMQSYCPPRNEFEACHEKGKVPIPVSLDCS